MCVDGWMGVLQHELVKARRELQQAPVELQRKREAVAALQEAHEEVGGCK